MVDFQNRYFSAFPAIPLWHRWVAEQLQTTSTLTTPWGRERQFFGRATDDTTLREAIAYSPQSATADRTNLGLLKIWQSLPQVQLLAQTHDSVSFQCPLPLLDEIVPQALACMEIPISAARRTMIVPGEAKVGFNWAYWHEKTNPNGLKKWKPGLALSRMDSLSHPLG
jgi:DNA polymerase I-like protein with 3'-5' exonuclease and polymerase domains